MISNIARQPNFLGPYFRTSCPCSVSKTCFDPIQSARDITHCGNSTHCQLFPNHNKWPTFEGLLAEVKKLVFRKKKRDGEEEKLKEKGKEEGKERRKRQRERKMRRIW